MYLLYCRYAEFNSFSSSLLKQKSLENRAPELRSGNLDLPVPLDLLQQSPLPAMSYSSRPLPSHIRQASTSGNLASASTGQSPILLARISEKKAELENLKQLRDLSAGLAGQMQMLEEKLATLSDGTEGKHISTLSCSVAVELTRCSQLLRWY